MAGLITGPLTTISSCVPFGAQACPVTSTQAIVRAVVGAMHNVTTRRSCKPRVACTLPVDANPGSDAVQALAFVRARFLFPAGVSEVARITYAEALITLSSTSTRNIVEHFTLGLVFAHLPRETGLAYTNPELTNTVSRTCRACLWVHPTPHNISTGIAAIPRMAVAHVIPALPMLIAVAVLATNSIGAVIPGMVCSADT